MKKLESTQAPSASELISKRIAELADWRGGALGQVRAPLTKADPAALEEWQWNGSSGGSPAGSLCTGGSYKSVVALTFGNGRALQSASASLR